MSPEPTTLAYLAGVIDSDGYITINRSERKGLVYHGPQIGIAGTRRQPHDLAASIWGGNVGCFVPKNRLHRPQFQWTRQGASAVSVIEALYPYLLVKIDQADLALELWDHTEEGRWTKSDPYPWFGPHYDPIEHRDDLRAQMIGLNQSRNRSGRLLDGVEYNSMPGVRA